MSYMHVWANSMVKYCVPESKHGMFMLVKQSWCHCQQGCCSWHGQYNCWLCGFQGSNMLVLSGLLWSWIFLLNINGLVQEKCNSSGPAMKLYLSCTNLLIWSYLLMTCMLKNIYICDIVLQKLYCCSLFYPSLRWSWKGVYWLHFVWPAVSLASCG